MEADVFISVYNFDQSAASSQLTPNTSVKQAVHIACIFNVVEMYSCILICFYIGFTHSKNAYNAVLCCINKKVMQFYSYID